MSNRILILAASSALALASSSALASTESGPGYVRLDSSSSNSVSKSIAGYDFGVGYSATLRANAVDWDTAEDCSANFGTPACNMAKAIVSTPCTGSVGAIATCKVVHSIYKGMLTDDLTGQEAGFRASFQVPATIFDKDFDLFELKGSGVASTTGTLRGSYEVDALGAVVASGSAGLPINTRLVNNCLTLVKVSGNYMMGPIPVTATASADGCLYVDAGISFNSGKLTGTVTLGASVDASLSAGFGVSVASAGISGSITIIDASVPFTASGKATSSLAKFTGSAKLSMTGMDGDVGVYAQFLGIGYDKTIFNWSGLTYADETLFSESKSVKF